MKKLIIAAAFVMGGSVALSDTANVLLDADRLKTLTEAEYLTAVRAAKNVNARDAYSRTPLHIAAMYGKAPEIIAALIEAGANVNARDERDDSTPLHAAAAALDGSAMTIAALIKGGADVNARSKGGFTALHMAASLAPPEIIAALSDAGADANARDKDGATPLHWAARHGRSEVVTALMTAGANVNARTKFGATPLHWAAAYSPAPEIIAALMTAGANVNARTLVGTTPLHDAARHGSPEVVIALIQRGADGSAKDKDGNTPFILAWENEKLKGTDAYWKLSDAQFE